MVLDYYAPSNICTKKTLINFVSVPLFIESKIDFV